MLKLLLFIMTYGYCLGTESNLQLPPPTLMPLIPGDPLELDARLREKLFENQASEDVAIFKQRTFPWLQVLGVLLLMSAGPFLFKRWMELSNRRPKEVEIPSLQSLLQRIEQLEQSPSGNLKEDTAELADTFKLAFQSIVDRPIESLTFQELLPFVRRWGEPTELQKLFEELDAMQFNVSTPSSEELKTAIGEVKKNLVNQISLKYKS